jgi:hypothetical protein
VPVDVSRFDGPIWVIRTGERLDADGANELIAALTAVMDGPRCGLVLNWGAVDRDARRAIADFYEASIDRLRHIVVATASVVAPATVEANRRNAAEHPERRDRNLYAATEDECIALVMQRLADDTQPAPGQSDIR